MSSFSAAVDSLPSPVTSDSGDEGAFNFSLPPKSPIGVYERKLGDNETSYFLPSRADGVNDMYLHLGFKAPHRLVHRERISVVWALLRLQHPLLASHIRMHSYDDIRFVYRPPGSPDAALRDADEQLEWKYEAKDELIDTYLNGPRTLSATRLSYLIISHTPSSDPYPSPPQTPTASVDVAAMQSVEELHDFSFFLAAVHSIGDGMALHAFANDFFCLLGSSKSVQELNGLLVAEWEKRWASPLSDKLTALPPSYEESLMVETSAFRRAVGRVDFETVQNKQIGGQAFPRRKDPVRHTVVPTLAFDEDVTKRMLKKCKVNGVSIAGALFAVCNVAWARATSREQQKLPMMTYAAMNVRPCLVPRPMNDSYFFLSVGYFNVTLPAFLPSSEVEGTFWHRARSAKTQITQAAKTPMLTSRCHNMSIQRGRQSRTWAAEDDLKAAGAWTPPPTPAATAPAAAIKPPSSALLGLSMLGNLDGMYMHKEFADIRMHTLTTGSRQRNGAMLLFGYTFAGRLWVSLGYDENGFEPKPVAIFWQNMLDAMNEFLA
ncbi:hypothetical protein PENSPDRAFT_681526 [Peniophora sp. CONT]|nr:hypothetical protein PENSPDRAFT_681526 [Peniophora sp. CONT]